MSRNAKTNEIRAPPIHSPWRVGKFSDLETDSGFAKIRIALDLSALTLVYAARYHHRGWLVGELNVHENEIGELGFGFGYAVCGVDDRIADSPSPRLGSPDQLQVGRAFHP